MATHTYIGTLTVLTCPECGMKFGLDVTFERERRNDHKTWYCPAGHSQWFPSKSEAEQLKADLEQTQRRLADQVRRTERFANEAKHAEHQRRAAKGQLTKIRKRIANGVCPACNRHFSDVHRHMSTQHPGFIANAQAQLESLDTPSYTES